MKKFFLLFALLTFSAATYAQSVEVCAKNSQEKCSQCDSSHAVFHDFQRFFSKSAAFAFTKINQKPVLLVSHETFGNNVNTDLQAIETSIFALDAENKIVCLGSIRSQGTLYPVSMLGDKFLVAGHRFVRVYTIRGDMPELILDSYADENSPNLQEMFNLFETAKPFIFERAE